MKTTSVLCKLYPEQGINGFTRNDIQIAFYAQVQALLEPEMRVLDFGAGAGKWSRLPEGFRKDMMMLKGKCARVVGIDPDKSVLENDFLDEAYVTDPTKPLPFEDASFDMVVSWAVFEHVSDPVFVAAELMRVLKPGGWICAYTPNRWGYPGIAAQLLPEKFHDSVISLAVRSQNNHQDISRNEEDFFPTLYRMNTIKQLKALFPNDKCNHHSYIFNGPPAYYANSTILARLFKFYEKLVPDYLGKTLHIFIQKKRSA